MIFHDSRDARFRFPGGARPLGETVRLSVRADGAKSATLRLWKDGREWRVPMAVSYTHLDVYKRQGVFIGPVVAGWIISALPTQLEGMTVNLSLIHI